MENKALILLIFLSILNFAPVAYGEDLSEHLLIYEVSPYSYSGSHMDYVALYNPFEYSVNLSGYYLTDGEGYLFLSGHVHPNSKIFIAENGTAFFKFFGFYPDYTYSSLHHNGSFSLSNEGDEVILGKDGRCIDVLVYGNSNYSGTGWRGPGVEVSQGHILRRKDLVDTDSAGDWTNFHRIGQSDFSPFEGSAEMEIFTYPDDYRELYRFIDGAQRQLDMEFYTFTSINLAHRIIERLDNGTRVRVLLEGSPVGGIKVEEKYIVQELYLHGAEIYFMVNGGTRHNRYSFVHSKFIIRDEKQVLISTENPGMHSISPCGNRGFGVIVKNGSFSRYMERVFEDDVKGVQDVVKYNGEFGYLNENFKMPVEVRHRVFEPVNITAKITSVLAPDHSLSEFEYFINGQSRVDVEALYIRDYALNMVYPKARRILVQYPVNGYDMKKFEGKDELVDILHAKVIIGDDAVFVGSVNFCYSSLTNNRELSLIIRSEKAVNYFEDVLDYDWHTHHSLLALMRVEANDGLKVDLRDSVGNIAEYRVYVDGRMIYRGKYGYITIGNLPEGRHTITGEVCDKYGDRDKVEVVVNVNSRFPTVDVRIFLFTVIFAVFLYKVWKDHG